MNKGRKMNSRLSITSAVISLGVLSISQLFAETDLSSLEKRVQSLEAQLSSQQLVKKSDTHLGGYGELHYNNVEGEAAEIDFHRFVLFVDHQFSDRIRFVSELELEHSLAGDGKKGEIELEQAFIELDLNKTSQLRVGLFLLPVGILNETHEPPTFFGVERNFVEKNILPTTWWEAGVGYSQKTENGFTFDGSLTSGLNIAEQGAVNDGNIRKGREKVSKAIAESLAMTVRLGYGGFVGTKLSIFAQYNTDVTQGTEDVSDEGVLYGASAQYNNGGFGVRALYAQWDIEGVATEAESQLGWYIEPSYTWSLKATSKVGVFARYADAEYYKGAEKNENITTTGVNYWPVEDVVFKVDYQMKKSGPDKTNQWNLGVGFQF